MTDPSPPVLGFAGWSGAGKTTLITRLIPLLIQQGIQPSIIKHAHHRFDIDYPGKDSYRFRKAGARQTLVASHQRWVLMDEHQRDREPDLFELLQKMDGRVTDLILVEGFRHVSIPKIEIHRPALEKPLLCENDPHIFALSSDRPIQPGRQIPVLDLNDPAAIARFIFSWLRPRL